MPPSYTVHVICTCSQIFTYNEYIACVWISLNSYGKLLTYLCTYVDSVYTVHVCVSCSLVNCFTCCTCICDCSHAHFQTGKGLTVQPNILLDQRLVNPSLDLISSWKNLISSCTCRYSRSLSFQRKLHIRGIVYRQSHWTPSPLIIRCIYRPLSKGWDTVTVCIYDIVTLLVTHTPAPPELPIEPVDSSTVQGYLVCSVQPPVSQKCFSCKVKLISVGV